ncbi:MAG: porin, partial [Dolichospermum sp.]
MLKVLSGLLLATPVVFISPIAWAGEIVENDDLAQVTSVSQLSDVQPTDWAFSALQSLVERY